MESTYLQSDDPKIRPLLLSGKTGLEMESLRTDLSGKLSMNPHPFNHELIVRDFCESQPEINTDVFDSVEGALGQLSQTLDGMRKELLKHNELLWPFSSPCLLDKEEEIEIAHVDPHGQMYRNYLSNRYGRRKMTFSGIHFNYSFSDDLIDAAFEKSGYSDRTNFSNQLYMHTAAWASRCGWLINALMNASPLMDGSYYESSLGGTTCFNGLSSARNSELGYWNFFTPLFDFASWPAYCRSIEGYCRQKLLLEARELYYPVRLKTKDVYTLKNIEHEPIDHIELRMVDLNPFEKGGLNPLDARFLRLFLIWCAFAPVRPFSHEEQILAIANFKSAAHYDLSLARIVDVNEHGISVKDAALALLKRIRDFFEKIAPDELDCIDLQISKIKDPCHYRYAWLVRSKFGQDYLESGIALAIDYARS